MDLKIQWGRRYSKWCTICIGTGKMWIYTRAEGERSHIFGEWVSEPDIAGRLRTLIYLNSFLSLSLSPSLPLSLSLSLSLYVYTYIYLHPFISIIYPRYRRRPILGIEVQKYTTVSTS